MKHKAIEWISLLIWLAAIGCGEDPVEGSGKVLVKDAGSRKDASSKRDGGTRIVGRTSDAGRSDASTRTPDASNSAAQVARGKYLVEALGACADCHTPRLPGGAGFDNTKALAGVDCFLDVAPQDDTKGCISARNLTDHETGLKNRSDREIKDMFTKGERPDGKALHPVMPYYVLGNMSAEDADAIVAFLRTVKGVEHMVAPNQAPFLAPAAPAPVVPKDKLPKPTASYADQAAAKRGMYLAASFGVCMECHTPRDEQGAFVVDKAFQGGNRFLRDELRLPGFFPEAIYTSNITPDVTGIKGWSVDDVVHAIKQGIDKDKKPLCPPMPAGPMSPFGALTDNDVRDIAHYLLSLPPKANTIPADCEIPAPPDPAADAGP